MTLGEKIYALRKKAGLSQLDLADRLGVSRQAVSKWETGEAAPELSKLAALAKEFGVSADYLLSEDDVPPVQEAPAQNAAPQQFDAAPRYPAWVDHLPRTLGNLLRRFGWLAGVYVAGSGALFAGIGALARYIADRMFSGFERSFGSGFGNTVITGLPDGFTGTDFLLGGTDPGFQEMAQNNPVSIMGGFVFWFGIALLIGGIVLAVILYRYGHRKPHA